MICLGFAGGKQFCYENSKKHLFYVILNSNFSTLNSSAIITGKNVS